jgi:ketosteroid isomerase-like protein
MLSGMWKKWLIALALIALTASLWLWRLCAQTPQQQVMARQNAFLLAVEERDWDQVLSMLTPDYADDYGHDRESAVEDARQVLAGFFTLTIKPQVEVLQAVPDLGMVKMKIRIEGRGAGFSEAVIGRVNSLEEPWFFHWHKRGRWPWSWQIVQIHNDGLRL